MKIYVRSDFQKSNVDSQIVSYASKLSERVLNNFVENGFEFLRNASLDVDLHHEGRKVHIFDPETSEIPASASLEVNLDISNCPEAKDYLISVEYFDDNDGINLIPNYGYVRIPEKSLNDSFSTIKTEYLDKITDILCEALSQRFVSDTQVQDAIDAMQDFENNLSDMLSNYSEYISSVDIEWSKPFPLTSDGELQNGNVYPDFYFQLKYPASQEAIEHDKHSGHHFYQNNKVMHVAHTIYINLTQDYRKQFDDLLSSLDAILSDEVQYL